EPGAGGVAAQRARRPRLDLGERTPGTQAVVEGGGERLLRRQPVVGKQHARAARGGEASRQGAMRHGAAETVTAAMEVDDRPLGRRRRDLEHRDAAELALALRERWRLRQARDAEMPDEPQHEQQPRQARLARGSRLVCARVPAVRSVHRADASRPLAKLARPMSSAHPGSHPRIGIFGWGVVAPRSPDIDAFERNLSQSESWLSPFQGFGPSNFLVGEPEFDFAAYKEWVDARFEPRKFAQLDEKMGWNVKYAIGAFVQSLRQNPGLEE